MLSTHCPGFAGELWDTEMFTYYGVEGYPAHTDAPVKLFDKSWSQSLGDCYLAVFKFSPFTWEVPPILGLKPSPLILSS